MSAEKKKQNRIHCGRRVVPWTGHFFTRRVLSDNHLPPDFSPEGGPHLTAPQHQHDRCDGGAGGTRCGGTWRGCCSARRTPVGGRNPGDDRDDARAPGPQRPAPSLPPPPPCRPSSSLDHGLVGPLGARFAGRGQGVSGKDEYEGLGIGTPSRKWIRNTQPLNILKQKTRYCVYPEPSQGLDKLAETRREKNAVCVYVFRVAGFGAVSEGRGTNRRRPPDC